MQATLAKSFDAAKTASAFNAIRLPDPADLLAWYELHARILPWRVGPAERLAGIRPDPYRVWLSEVMLQQTTVKAVIPYFARFLARWPTIRDLAAAPENDVMAAWAGLGYYSRARNLIACARAVAARPGSCFPASAGDLGALPGIGAYTSAAIAALAFGQPVPVIDANVERVVTRLFAVDKPLPVARPLIRDCLRPLVPPDRPGEFAEALMDLGATICTPRRPACALCPWFDPCRARRLGRQEEFPVKAVKRARPTRYGAAFVARRADGAILLRRRPPRGLLGGMCEVPGGDWLEEPPAASAPFQADWVPLAPPVAHGFTHFELKLIVHVAEIGPDADAPDGHWWAPAATLGREALPTVMRKVLSLALGGAFEPSSG